MDIIRSALVLHPAINMFRLVQDVPAYPQFLSWCVRSEVHEQTAEMQLATLTVKVSGMTQTFTTRNRFVTGERLTLYLPHVAGDAGNTGEAAVLVEHGIGFILGQFLEIHDVQNDGRINITATAAHHQSFERCEAHCRIH